MDEFNRIIKNTAQALFLGADLYETQTRLTARFGSEVGFLFFRAAEVYAKSFEYDYSERRG